MCRPAAVILLTSASQTLAIRCLLIGPDPLSIRGFGRASRCRRAGARWRLLKYALNCVVIGQPSIKPVRPLHAAGLRTTAGRYSVCSCPACGSNDTQTLSPASGTYAFRALPCRWARPSRLAVHLLRRVASYRILQIVAVTRMIVWLAYVSLMSILLQLEPNGPNVVEIVAFMRKGAGAPAGGTWLDRSRAGVPRLRQAGPAVGCGRRFAFFYP